MHVRADDEHGLALALFAGIARRNGARAVLDVGAGTGRALELLSAELPQCRLTGIEPSEALRSVGHAKGLSEDQLIGGSGEALPFADDAFDFVIETGMLHHVPDPAQVVAEMVGVARVGVMISDSNKYAQGPWALRKVKALIELAGLWTPFIWLQTRGKMAKWHVASLQSGHTDALSKHKSTADELRRAVQEREQAIEGLRAEIG